MREGFVENSGDTYTMNCSGCGSPFTIHINSYRVRRATGGRVSVKSRLDRLESARGPEMPCTHRILILYDGGPGPEITCECPRTHAVIVVCYPDGERVPRRGGEPATL